MPRILKYLAAIFLLVIAVVSLGGLIIAWYYQDEVKQLMISQVNKHIRTEIRVSDISFSVLRKFPRASVEFRDVLIMVPEEFEHEGTEEIYSDTLFTAQNLFLQFNLRDIFKSDYRINTIHARNGVIYVAVNSRGQENYIFWDESGSQAEDFDLDLQDVRLDNFSFKFSNHIKEIQLDTDVRRFELKGNFSRSSHQMKAFVSGKNRYLRYQGLTFSEIPDISVRTSLNIDNNLISIEKGAIDLSGVRLTADGFYEKGSPGSVDINLGGYDLDLASLIHLLPSKIQKSTDPWKISGKFDFTAAVSGIYSKTVSPSVVASFNSESGEIIRKSTGMSFKNINLTGYYSNGRFNNAGSSTIALSNFYADLGNGSFSGKGRVNNLAQPQVSFDIDVSVLLEEVSQFYIPSNIHKISGRLNTSFSIKGLMNKPFTWDINELNKMDIDGMLAIESGSLEMSEGKYLASGIDGKLNFGETLRTPGLSFFIGSDHFSINGEIKNGLPWLLGDEKTMHIAGGLYSRQLNLDNYILPGSDRQHGEEDKDSLLFPANLELNLDFVVDDLKFRNFSSSGFNGKLSYKPRMLVLNAVEFDAMDGAVSGNGVIHQGITGDFMVQSQLQMQEVDMQKLFFTFGNFGQTFIHGDNLRGNLSGSLGLISEWKPDLRVIREKLVADSRILIRDGELIGFEPMLGLGRFIDVSELQHIRFSTLENEIFIRNQVVTIPHMSINSSAFDISGSGVHRFDGHFDYRMSILLSDVLYGKSSRKRPKNQEFGIVEDDGLGRTRLYLLVSGTSGDYNVSYDHRAVRDVIKDNIASERNVLRQLLHEEFGWFSGRVNADDSGSREAPGNSFIITWDEDEEEWDKDGQASPPGISPEPPAGRESESKERRFEIIWDEKEEPAENTRRH